MGRARPLKSIAVFPQTVACVELIEAQAGQGGSASAGKKLREKKAAGAEAKVGVAAKSDRKKSS